MKPLHIVTPVFENPAINHRLGKEIYFKMDCFQPVGSFKIRGIGALCQHAKASGATKLVSSSGGNAGYAASYAGRLLHIPVTVVVPETTNPTAIERMRSQGAEVIIHGSEWIKANELAREIVAEQDAAYVHPFDDPLIWNGHSTIADEFVEQCPKPDVVVVSVGGGGLMAGLLEGMHRQGWNDVPVLAVETQGADSFAQSIAQGEVIQLSKITSIAPTLGASRVADEAFQWSKRHTIHPVVVSDRQAVDACLNFTEDFRVLVEPACGASLSLIYNQLDALANYKSILMIVCGGIGVSYQQLLTWQQNLV